MTILQQLRDAVNDSGATILSLAEEMDISQPALNRFAKGERNMSHASLQKIADYFEMRLTKPKKIRLR